MKNDNVVAIAGIRKIVSFDDKNANGFMAFTPYISYRYSSSASKVIYISGDVREDRESRINRRIGSGVGQSIIKNEFKVILSTPG